MWDICLYSGISSDLLDLGVCNLARLGSAIAPRRPVFGAPATGNGSTTAAIAARAGRCPDRKQNAVRAADAVPRYFPDTKPLKYLHYRNSLRHSGPEVWGQVKSLFDGSAIADGFRATGGMTKPIEGQRGFFGLLGSRIGKQRGDAAANLHTHEALLLLQNYEESGEGWFWSTDAKGRLTYITDSVARLMGRTNGNAARHGVYRAVPARRQPRRTATHLALPADQTIEVRRSCRYAARSRATTAGGRYRGGRSSTPAASSPAIAEAAPTLRLSAVRPRTRRGWRSMTR
jgi:hypothetical protein